MSESKKTVLIGAGAVGAYIVMGLYDKYGDDFMIAARGERGDRLKSLGLIINGRTYKPRIVTPAEAAACSPDFLIVALKSAALPGALDDIAASVTKNTAVVSLMNGVDSEEIIGGRIGMDHMLYSLIKIASTRHGSSVTFPLPEGEKMGIFVGVPAMYKAYANGDGAGGPAAGRYAYLCKKAEEFKALFDGTRVLCHVSDNILAAMWDKFGVNISRNLPQAVLGAGAGVYEDSAYVAELSRMLRHEVVMLAAAKGITIKEESYYAEVQPSQRYSTLQDLDAGRTTEIEMFSGAHIRMAEKLGVPCPANKIMYYLIKALEEKNEGKFDYE